MKIIASAHNESFKLLKRLADSAQARRKHQAAWIEGERLCQAYLDAMKKAQHPAPVLVVSGRGQDELVDTLGPRCRDIWVLDDKLFASLTTLETGSNWGLIVPAVSAQPRAESELPVGDQMRDVVVLDRLQDPGNLGSLLRAAAAAGVTEAWCLAPSVDVWSPKALRAAMGAHFGLHLVTGMTEQDLFAQAQGRQLRVCATANQSTACSLYAGDLGRQPIAWVFGQEGSGVSPAILEQANLIQIPQSDAVESLNVATAAAICLFERRRQLLS